ncbi:MAG: hypothetical protein AB7I48_20515 [Planctomycetaceae bacterium]
MALVTVVGTAIATATVQATPPAVTVSGGGTASFDFVDGLTSQFSIGAVIADDGEVQGHFMCMIVAVVTISGEITEGTLNDDGSVTFSGVGHGIDHILGEPFEDCDFTVTLWSGGPGVGRFLYSDCVVPPPGDAETVEAGKIKIKVH